jgi:hypothetical protein
MQHLPIRLPYEAKRGGPVQYRWMYPFERALKRLRHIVGNKARVEGCIVEEFKYKEIAYFRSVYLIEVHNVNVPTMWYHVHNDDPHSDLSIFKSNGMTVGVGRLYHLSEEYVCFIFFSFHIMFLSYFAHLISILMYYLVLVYFTIGCQKK